MLPYVINCPPPDMVLAPGDGMYVYGNPFALNHVREKLFVGEQCQDQGRHDSHHPHPHFEVQDLATLFSHANTVEQDLVQPNGHSEAAGSRTEGPTGAADRRPQYREGNARSLSPSKGSDSVVDIEKEYSRLSNIEEDSVDGKADEDESDNNV